MMSFFLLSRSVNSSIILIVVLVQEAKGAGLICDELVSDSEALLISICKLLLDRNKLAIFDSSSVTDVYNFLQASSRPPTFVASKHLTISLFTLAI